MGRNLVFSIYLSMLILTYISTLIANVFILHISASSYYSTSFPLKDVWCLFCVSSELCTKFHHSIKYRGCHWLRSGALKSRRLGRISAPPCINFAASTKFLFLLLFTVVCATHGSSQARGCIRAAAVSLRHKHSNHQIRSMFVTYSMTCGNSGSTGSTYWVRPGIEPASSRILVRFLTRWATMGTPQPNFLAYDFSSSVRWE